MAGGPRYRFSCSRIYLRSSPVLSLSAYRHSAFGYVLVDAFDFDVEELFDARHRFAVASEKDADFRGADRYELGHRSGEVRANWRPMRNRKI